MEIQIVLPLLPPKLFILVLLSLLPTAAYGTSLPLTRGLDQTAASNMTSALSYNKTYTAYEVSCVYAVSGPYCLVQRILFYSIAVYVFCFRFHKWLTTFGLGYLVTTSTVMSLHGIFLAADPGIGRDLDYVVVSRLLVASTFLGMAIVVFAPKGSNISSRRVVGGWQVFLIIGAMTVLFRLSTFLHSFEAPAAVQVCRVGGACVDTCNSILTATLLRGTNDNLQAFDTMNRLDLPIYSNRTYAPDHFTDYNVDLTILANTIAQSYHPAKEPSTGATMRYGPLVVTSVLLLLPSFNLIKSPSTARNEIIRVFTQDRYGAKSRNTFFRIILILWRVFLFSAWPLHIIYIPLRYLPGGHRLPDMFSPIAHWISDDATRRPDISTRRKRTVRAFAVTWFVYGRLGDLAWPAFFLYHIISFEIGPGIPVLIDYEQEIPRNIGQWTPWAIAALSISATVFHRYAHPESDVDDIWTLQGMEKPAEDERPRWIGRWSQSWYWYAITKNAKDELVLWWKNPVAESWKGFDDSDEEKLKLHRPDSVDS